MTDAGGRRSLTNVGGKVEQTGNAEASQKLAHALDVSGSIDDEESARAHVHGFHSYPARMHPQTARRLVEAFSPTRGVVLDPFCGSGTVLVEALLASRDAFGSDINPLAVELARAKTSRVTKAEADELMATAIAIAKEADARRTARAGATRRLPNEDVVLFSPHVLLELDSLRAGIEKVERPRLKMPLFLALSAILVKVSLKRSDTSEQEAPRRIAAGYTAKLFTKKVEELCHKRADFSHALTSTKPRVFVQIDDAAVLSKIAPASVDAVITSPPYAATYDYLAQHEMRLRWLGLSAKGFEAAEIGSRRSYAPLAGPAAQARAVSETFGFLSAMAKTLKPDGSIVLVIGDSAVKKHALRADVIVTEAAKRAGLFVVARATQTRQHFHAPTAGAFSSAPRAEHAILLRHRKVTMVGAPSTRGEGFRSRRS